MTGSTALLTDRYELTMLTAALESGTARHRAVFEVFCRQLPPGRRYGVLAGTIECLHGQADSLTVSEHGEFFDDYPPPMAAPTAMRMPTTIAAIQPGWRGWLRRLMDWISSKVKLREES